MNRRAFLTRLLAGAAAPLIAKPTWEEIERLTWKRRFFPGYDGYSSTGMNIRLVRTYDVQGDRFTTRLDLINGWALVNPELAVRLEA